MKNFFLVLTVWFCANLSVNAQRLVVRMDDMGASHAENLAIIKCYTEGIGTSAEIMPVCSWFLEAAEMLNENPGLGVGVHIALNSEWKGYKWKPITHCPSLCDEDGYLNYLGFGPNPKPIDLNEVEAEVRAQIELAMKYIKNVTHINDHMAWTMTNPELRELAEKVAKDYGLVYQGGNFSKEIGLNSLGMIMAKPGEKREGAFLEALKKMENGKTYWTIEHPGLDNEEMKGIYLIAPDGTKNDVGADRQDVTDTFTSKVIMQYIKNQGIELVSFGDLIQEYNNN